MNWKVICTALICITVLESIALIQGINGTLLTAVIGAICGIVGWRIPIKESVEVKL